MQPSKFQVYNASAGSGKTYTLVREYLVLLLNPKYGNAYKHILAITFTNKAAAEMKERVLKELRALAENSSGELSDLGNSIAHTLNCSPKQLQIRAAFTLESILQNYSAFNIATIDSFTYRLIRSFAYDLGLPLNFEVEMDSKTVLAEAVDLLMAQLGENSRITDVLINFALQKTDEDKSWDIKRELKDTAELLLKEDNQPYLKELEKKPVSDFIGLQKNLRKQTVVFENRMAQIGEQGLSLIQSVNVPLSSFSDRGVLPNYFKKLKTKDFKTITYKIIDKRIEANHHFSSGKATSEDRAAIATILDGLIGLVLESKVLFEKEIADYFLYKEILKNLIPLATLNELNKVLNTLKEERNIRFNAEFNQLISQKLQNQPAPYIYERIGERFKHYFIDEMQDTSVLQWQNLIPLIHNALSQEHTGLLLVGDVKQSIYRWRGSNPEQFLNLSVAGEGKKYNPFLIPKKIEPLDTNYRSLKNIIRFNNSFFTHIARYLKKEIYKQIYLRENQQKETDKSGGYVEVSFLEAGLSKAEKELAYAEKVLEIVTRCSKQFQCKEMCILVRKNQEGVRLASYLAEKGIKIVSQESLLLKQSLKVDFIINMMCYLNDPKDATAQFNVLYFLYDRLSVKTEKHVFISRLIHKNPLVCFDLLSSYGVSFNPGEALQYSVYELVEYIIRSFNLADSADAYIQFFLDDIFTFSTKKLNDLHSFLSYWEENKEKLSITVPEGENAVKIMTIHKAKGLEFPVVIVPANIKIKDLTKLSCWYPIENPDNYNGFKHLYISANETLKDTGKVGNMLYDKIVSEQQFDNYNLLYVAYTRAVEQLFIVLEQYKSSSLDRTDGLLKDYLKTAENWLEKGNTFSYGNPLRIDASETSDKNNKTLYRFNSTTWRNKEIKIATSSSLLWNEEKAVLVQYGNLVHEIMAQVFSEDDVMQVLNIYRNQGIISDTERDTLSKLITQLVNHPQLRDYYKQELIVYNEREILTADGQIVIPDRIVFNDKKEAIIIDYKTGLSDKSYHQQINNYAAVLEQLGFTVIKKLLVYLDEVITVEEVKY